MELQIAVEDHDGYNISPGILPGLSVRSFDQKARMRSATPR